MQAVVTKHLVAPAPSAQAGRSDVSPLLSTSIQRALAKVPAERFDRWSDFIETFRPVSPERVLTPRRREVAFLVIAALSLTALGWLLFARSRNVTTWEMLLLAAPLGAAVTGWRTQRSGQSASRPARPFELPASFEAGLYGGLIGGALGGIFIGVLFVSELIAARARVAATTLLVAEIFLFATLAGAVFGATILLGMSWCRRFVTTSTLVRDVLADCIGASVGGAIGGAAVGVLMALVFARRPIPAPSAIVIFAGVSFIGAAIVGGTLLYDYRGRVRKLVLPFVGGAVVTVFAIVFTVAFFPYEAVVNAFWMAEDQSALTAWSLSAGGVIIGGMAGVMLGLQTGATMAIHRTWRAGASRIKRSADDGTRRIESTEAG